MLGERFYLIIVITEWTRRKDTFNRQVKQTMFFKTLTPTGFKSVKLLSTAKTYQTFSDRERAAVNCRNMYTSKLQSLLFLILSE